MGSEIEMSQRKIGKDHVVIPPAEFREGQTVTVARLDTRTVLVSMDAPERVQALVERLTQREASLWDALTARVSGRPHHSDRTPRRRAGVVEPDVPVSDEEVLALDAPKGRLRIGIILDSGGQLTLEGSATPALPANAPRRQGPARA